MNSYSAISGEIDPKRDIGKTSFLLPYLHFIIYFNINLI